MSSEPEKEISVGALARETGVSTATINFYVQQGILPAPRKLSRTRALYPERHIRLIRVIRRCQALGLSLAQVRAQLKHVGQGEEGLAVMESIGRIQPLPLPRGAPEREPIEPFEPISRGAFLARAGIDAVLLDQLESAGLLCPAAPDRYAHTDLWMLRSMQTLLADGISIDELSVLRELAGPLRAAIPLVLRQIHLHLPELRTRELRMRDLLEPYANTVQYLFDRLLDEADPRWRDKLYEPA